MLSSVARGDWITGHLFVRDGVRGDEISAVNAIAVRGDEAGRGDAADVGSAKADVGMERPW